MIGFFWVFAIFRRERHDFSSSASTPRFRPWATSSMMLRTTAKSSEVLQGHCQHASESSESSDHRENIRKHGAKHGAKHWEIHRRCKEYRTWELRKSAPISVYVCVSFVCQKSQHFSQKNCVTCSSDFM